MHFTSGLIETKPSAGTDSPEEEKSDIGVCQFIEITDEYGGCTGLIVDFCLASMHSEH